jgi:hypothetical protein
MWDLGRDNGKACMFINLTKRQPGGRHFNADVICGPHFFFKPTFFLQQGDAHPEIHYIINPQIGATHI